MLIKTNEFNQDINDMYFFRIVDKTIIINDNYSGVLILNENFAILKTLKLLEGIVIYSSYVNSINKEILLYCPDNEAIVYMVPLPKVNSECRNKEKQRDILSWKKFDTHLQ